MTTLAKTGAPRMLPRERLRLATSEILGTAVIMLVYFWLRGIRPPDVDGSVGRSLQVIHFNSRSASSRRPTGSRCSCATTS